MDKAEKIRNMAKTNLKFLCQDILWCNSKDKDWAPVHSEIEEFLKKTGQRKLVLVARGHLKSSIVTKAWSIQQALINPNIRILIANDTWNNARKYLSTIEKYLAHGSPLSIVFGTFQSTQWNQEECTIRQRREILDAPTWTTTGIEKEQTGQHYDLIIADDLVARENVGTPEQREKVKLYYKDLLDLLEPDGRLVVVGTRWHQDDLYGHLIEEGNFDVFLRTAYKDEACKEVIFPQKFSLAHLDKLRAEKGPYEFSAQYKNNPIDESAADFKSEWIRYYKDWSEVPKLSLFLTIDPAISLSRDADYTAMIVAGMAEDGRIYVVDYVHKRMVPSALVSEAFRLVDKWKLMRIGIETNAFQLTLKYDMQRVMRESGKFFTIEEMGRRDNQDKKEARIRRLQPRFEQGLIYLRKDMTAIVDELLAFPRGRHDDLIDALSRQIDYLVPGMSSAVTRETIPGSMKDVLQRTWNNKKNGPYEYFKDLSEARAFLV